MKIKEFSISGLYKKYSFGCKIDEKVNIIVGNNGSFKTTMLVLMQKVLRGEHLQAEHGNIKAVNIEFDNLTAVHYRQIEDTRVNFEEKAKSDISLTEIVNEIRKLPMDKEAGSQIIIRVEQFGYSSADGSITENDFRKGLNVDFISTFDVKKDVGNKEHSDLDNQLNALQSEYSYYLSDLARKMTDLIAQKGSITKEEYESINRQKELLLNMVNRAFSHTGKELLPNESKLTFRFKNGEEIRANSLSTGEKQLLIILLTVLLEREREYIVFMDEPELSLHIDWQYNLIEMLTQLNPNAQLILTTHSPSIFSDGWADKAIYMEDITTED